MLNYRAASYALFRITFGVMFLVFGIQKFQAGIGNTASGIGKQFEGKLPAVLVSPFSHVLPFLEVIVGVLLVLGLFTEIGIVLAGLLMLALTFGVIIAPLPNVIFNNMVYAFFALILMWLVDNNKYSVDHFVRRKH